MRMTIVFDNFPAVEEQFRLWVSSMVGYDCSWTILGEPHEIEGGAMYVANRVRSKPKHGIILQYDEGQPDFIYTKSPNWPVDEEGNPDLAESEGVVDEPDTGP